jgi:hypothetical protein
MFKFYRIAHREQTKSPLRRKIEPGFDRKDDSLSYRWTAGSNRPIKTAIILTVIIMIASLLV